MSTCYKSNFWSSYADIEIARNDLGKTYKDSCSNVISLENGKPPATGYKRYNHLLFPWVYINDVKHNNERQRELIGLGSKGYKGVTVIYWSYDHDNLLPLLVGLTTDKKNYTYYEKSGYYLGNSWKRIGTKEAELPKKLKEISSSRKDVISIRLHATTGNLQKYVHTPDLLAMIVLSTNDVNGGIPFYVKNLLTHYVSASVYFWNEDQNNERPLLLELYHGASVYFKITPDGKKWINDNITTSNINRVLDKENCRRNGAHQIDISKNVSNDYKCLNPECNVNIEVSALSISDYSRSDHHISGRSSTISVVKFKDNGVEQTGLPSVKGVQYITVFFYPDKDGIPLLIDYQGSNSHKWFKRTSSTVNTWQKVPEKDRPEHDGDHKNILINLLDSYSPEVTIDIHNIGVQQKEGKYVYTDPDSGQEITVIRKEVEDLYKSTEYLQLIHGTSNYYSFKLKAVKRGKEILNNISTAEIFTSVTVYYRKEDDSRKSTWIKDINTSALENKGIKTKLDDIRKLRSSDVKDKLQKGLPKPKHSQSPPQKSKPSPDKSKSESSHENVGEDEVYFDKSTPVGPAVGGTIGALVAAVVIVLLKRQSLVLRLLKSRINLYKDKPQLCWLRRATTVPAIDVIYIMMAILAGWTTKDNTSTQAHSPIIASDFLYNTLVDRMFQESFYDRSILSQLKKKTVHFISKLYDLMSRALIGIKTSGSDSVIITTLYPQFNIRLVHVYFNLLYRHSDHLRFLGFLLSSTQARATKKDSLRCLIFIKNPGFDGFICYGYSPDVRVEFPDLWPLVFTSVSQDDPNYIYDVLNPNILHIRGNEVDSAKGIIVERLRIALEAKHVMEDEEEEDDD
ncbi:hypothetical protein BEWA_046000 [Theileria equi strain WA]|uniref:Uncharacterized protein n=1 Tax=Theileria equi strain WA TaxID=1537102 RepID=L1L9G3_THEEQ|nr:hypothetical protein BEWA_046000 [Theileria equi strain WA]EKX72136.1 hypothetical protein BEWA_046000 [Theileria equi strain WA]|eukprot:XP_004831588.1 hypothetical protein BEWA_046000 [Theileria equi strain WA]